VFFGVDWGFRVVYYKGMKYIVSWLHIPTGTLGSTEVSAMSITELNEWLASWNRQDGWKYWKS